MAGRASWFPTSRSVTSIVPTAAIRDEGTSYHYLPPAREVEPYAPAVDAIVATLERHHVPHVTGKTWTTDGLYRETREGRPSRRRGVPHGRDGGRGVLRGRRVPRGRRSGSCSTRATTSRATPGTTAGGTSTPPAASCCSAWRPRRAWSFPPDSRQPGPFGILRAWKPRTWSRPRDIGKRVTFQFELPNGFLSEVVGVFERYDEGAETYFVRRKTGEVVRVPARGSAVRQAGRRPEAARAAVVSELPSAFIRRAPRERGRALRRRLGSGCEAAARSSAT